MIRIYTGEPRPRGTARRLARELQYIEGDGVVNWSGTPLSSDIDIILNSESRTNKLAQLTRLGLKDIPVPPWSPFPREGWLPRTSFHQQGRDFTSPPTHPDFWVQRIPLEDEWRLHFFRTRKGNMKLLRSGIKLPKTLKAHPWVKSHRLGWKISYIGGAPASLVEVGRRAVEALQLDFGAVDVALTPTRQPIVLEVNTCPGLDSGTLLKYVDAIEERLGVEE